MRPYMPGKKIKAMWYDSFQELGKEGDKFYRLNLPPCLCIYYTVNVVNLRLYEPSMLN